MVDVGCAAIVKVVGEGWGRGGWRCPAWVDRRRGLGERRLALPCLGRSSEKAGGEASGAALPG